MVAIPSAKFLVYRCAARLGLGHTLKSILNCAYYALASNRTLLLDMREFKYFSEPRTSFGDEFYIDAPPSLVVSSDLDLIDRLYSEPKKRISLFEQDLFDPSVRYEDKIIIIPGRFLSFFPEGRKRIYIRLKGKIGLQFDRIARKYFEERPVVGVHFRDANGEYLNGRFDCTSPNFASSYGNLIDQYVTTCNKICSSIGAAKILLTSNNVQFMRAITDRIPGCISITGNKDGRSHQTYNEKGDRVFLEQAVLDLWILSECDYLVCGPSAFSEFAFLNSTRLTSMNVIDGPLMRAQFDRSDQVEELLRHRAATIMDSEDFETWANALQAIGQTEEVKRLRKHQRWRDYKWNPDWLESINLMRAGMFTLAREAAGKSIQIKRENPFLLVHMADLFKMEGDLKSAEHFIRLAIGCGDPSPWFYYDLASVLAEQERRTEAVAAASQALALIPNSLVLRQSVDRLLANRWILRLRWPRQVINKMLRWVWRRFRWAVLGPFGYTYLVETAYGDNKSKQRIIRKSGSTLKLHARTKMRIG